LRRKFLTALCAASLVFGATGIALADDTIQPDGDIATNGLGPISYGGSGRACSTLGTAVDGAIKVNYNGNAIGDTHHFRAGEHLTVMIGAAPAGISVTADDASVPADWDDNTDTFNIGLHTTVSTSVADSPTDAPYQVDITVTGDRSTYSAGSESGNGKPHVDVAVACGTTGGGPTNSAPTVNAGGPYGGSEGSAISLSGARASDPDNDNLTYSWAYSAGSGVDPGASCSFSDVSVLNPTFTCTDDGAYMVTLTVDDGHGHTPSANATVNVDNANPSVGAVGVNPSSACTVSVGASFTDAGVNDSHTASINWGDSSSSSASVTETVGTGTGSVDGGSHTYTSAGTKTIGITVTDDDGGSGSNSGSFATLNTPSNFLAPINTGAGPRSVFKLGSTIPVKITVRDCGGAVVSTLTPTVQLAKVDNVPDGSVNESQVTEVPTNGKNMRWDGTQYIYNLSTKNSQFDINNGSALPKGSYRLWLTNPTFFGGIGPVAYFDLS